MFFGRLSKKESYISITYYIHAYVRITHVTYVSFYHILKMTEIIRFLS